MKRYILIGPVLLLFVWWIVSAAHLINPFFLPGPLAVCKELIKMFLHENVAYDILATLKRISISFVASLVLGIPIGFFLGRSEKIYRCFEFIIDFARSLVPFSIFPLFLIIFGIGDLSKSLTAIFSTTFVVVLNVAYGVMNSKKTRIVAAQIMGATRIQILKSIIFWESLPSMFVGIRNALSWITVIIISAEMFVGTNAGLGHRIIDYQITYNIPGVYASIILTGVMGYCLNQIFAVLEKRVVHWSGK
jgi:ABC-type nitrate/sulfonate/bicarbonate transport system permease component